MREHKTSQCAARIVKAWKEDVAREDNFQNLFDLYQRSLYGFFYRRGFSSDQCQDLVQETFLGIYKGLHAFRSESRFEIWLYRIATNAAKKLLRERSATKRPTETPMQETDQDALVNDARRRRVHDSKPPEPLRQALASERKEVLKISEQTVKVQFHRARKRLREALQPILANQNARIRV